MRQSRIRYKNIRRQLEERIHKEKEANEIKNLQNINKVNLISNFKIKVKDKYDIDINNNLSLDNIKINAYTSIYPFHVNNNNQLLAIESWHNLGMEVYSLNTKEEIVTLKHKYPSYVNFIVAKKSTIHFFSKPYMLINEMVDNFSLQNRGDILMIINSDIIIKSSPDFINKIKSLTDLCMPIAHRHDYENDLSINRKYEFGFDVFFINKKYLNIFIPSLYSMGQTWWDYWIPYRAIKNDVLTFIINESFAFHKEHKSQYSDKSWVKMTNYFRWENDILENNPQLVNDNVRNLIINSSITFPL